MIIFFRNNKSNGLEQMVSESNIFLDKAFKLSVCLILYIVFYYRDINKQTLSGHLIYFFLQIFFFHS